MIITEIYLKNRIINHMSLLLLIVSNNERFFIIKINKESDLVSR